MSFVLLGVTMSCAAPAPTAPCLAEAPRVVTVPFQRLVNVFHEAESGTEIARFDFDRATAGDVTVTVEPAIPPFIEFNTGQPIGVQGHQVWSVRMEGLVGGAATDRVRSDVGENHRIREIVQVQDPTASRWIVGTATGSCVRLGINVDAGTLVIHVSEGE
jgi:hypothetical protein